MAEFALDLTVLDEDGEPWDFTNEDKRMNARRLVREQKPYMLIGPPARKDFAIWQYLNEAKVKEPAAMRRARIASIMHLGFVASLCGYQANGWRYFLHEHPQYATSWSVESIARVLSRGDV